MSKKKTKDEGLTGKFKQQREMPPKGIDFTQWEHDKRFFVERYGDEVPKETHPELVRMLSDLKEVFMARQSEERAEVAGDDDAQIDPERHYFDNYRHMDKLVLEYAQTVMSLALDEVRDDEPMDDIDYSDCSDSFIWEYTLESVDDVDMTGLLSHYLREPEEEVICRRQHLGLSCPS